MLITEIRIHLFPAADVYDADTFPQLLSWAEPLGDPPIRLSGTTDAFICRKDARAMPQFELLVLFEVKKEVKRLVLVQVFWFMRKKPRALPVAHNDADKTFGCIVL